MRAAAAGGSRTMQSSHRCVAPKSESNLDDSSADSPSASGGGKLEAQSRCWHTNAPPQGSHTTVVREQTGQSKCRCSSMPPILPAARLECGMKIDDYHRIAISTATYERQGHNPTYPALGLAGEAAEFGEKVLDGADQEQLAKEAGDVLWYISNMAREMRADLRDVAAAVTPDCEEFGDLQQTVSGTSPADTELEGASKPRCASRGGRVTCASA